MMNDSFGARLRRERERRQITLAQIADTTKIKASLFEGLERDNVSRWPNGIFRRAFVRAYAQAIGLDPELTCREFVERFPEPGDLPAEATGATAPGTGVRSSPSAAPARMSAPHTGRPSAATSTARWADAEDDTHLRLTLADHELPPAPRRLLGADAAEPAESGSRWRTVALDVGTVSIVALTAFILIDRFWMPLAVTSVIYYVGSSLVLGATPAALFFSNALAGHLASSRSTAITSLDRALEMRDVLRADARPRSVTPALRQPVDIDARRVSA